MLLRARAFVLVCMALGALVSCRDRGASEAPVRVAAAADLMFAFETLADEHGDELGYPISFSFGSSGLLARQLRGGAPFDLFASANVAFVDEVIAAGACEDATVARYAEGRIVLWTRQGSVEPPTSLADLADPRFARIAIANPEHAPYGQAAREALDHAGLWDTLKPRLVYGENIRQAHQFAQTGNVDAAIVAYALVIDDDDNPWSLVAKDRHEPIDQALVVCSGGDQREGAEAFAALLASGAGREVMRHYGFLLPHDAAQPETQVGDEL